MPRIFDNINHELFPALSLTLATAHRADFCVGFFNLRGWGLLDDHVEHFTGGPDHCCRVLIGMNEAPDAELRTALRLLEADDGLDLQRAAQLKRRVAEEFRTQLMTGAPSNQDERALQQLARQLRANKVVVKLHLRYSLHAKLYLIFREDYSNPVTGYLGSSNLTMAGLRRQGELNIDVLDHSATRELKDWFNERWNDRWSIDISLDLATVIEESWAREELLAPYLIYLKMAYHLSQEARAGLSEFTLPRDFRSKLFPFQEAAVKIAARYLNKQGGVLLGDVVGLGKTMMATALARIFKDDYGWQPLIICPKNLVTMWQDYNLTWDMNAEIIPYSQVLQRLPPTRRFRLVVIDESHTLRNRESKRYKAIHAYIQEEGCKVILLSATPYNKTYLDLSAQLRLFVAEDKDLGVRPEAFIRAVGETAFLREQVSPRSIRAFERSEFADDWRELMRLFLVRRTRSFIKDNYAERDPADGRSFLRLPDDRRFYFPDRVPRTLSVAASGDAIDPYSLLYAPTIVEAINALSLPRYGLANYLKPTADKLADIQEKPLLDNLSRAGKRLMGFSRTNLFKRLESSGVVFIQSLHRHILRNYVFLHALSNGLPLPLGTQGADVLDLDGDLDLESEAVEQGALSDDELTSPAVDEADLPVLAATNSAAWYTARAAEIYATYAGPLKRRFKWLRPTLFNVALKRDLLHDATSLLGILQAHAPWQPAHDAKLQKLIQLLQTEPGNKVLIFTQFADTVDYLVEQLQLAGIEDVAGVTGQSANPTELAYRFSPQSNSVGDAAILSRELRVLVATDVLSEGQNLQDCHSIVNYDLPWAIIRLIQRAGRVDRIGQHAPAITCYTFLPADGIELIIRLRARVRQRLAENGEVVGTDEQFFEDAGETQFLQNLYAGTAGVFDDAADNEVDLASYAYQIWRNATAANPALKSKVEDLPNVVYSARALNDPTAPLHQTDGQRLPPGVLVYLRTATGNDALAWVDEHGNSVTQSQSAILRAAACTMETAAVPRSPEHHALVQQAFSIVEQYPTLAGSLGSMRGARFRVYDALKRYVAHLQSIAPLLVTEQLTRVIDDVYRYPLRQSAVDTLNRQLRSGIADDQLADLVISLREAEQLSVIHEADAPDSELHIVCSLGLV
ncbi:MAG: NgoFVII family restriction endonuclease [Herpetosiphonaceae bacterium]|nr:NgoFVII family restriction endonuclease [Herpetosiphonaceae bacterium]